MARIQLRKLTPLLALAVLFCLQSFAWGAESAAQKEAAGPGKWYEDIVLGGFTILVFIALLIILRWKAWGPIMQGLQSREQTLHGAHSEAQKLREEASQLRLDWEKKMTEIQEQVRQIHEDARRLAERNAGEITAKARADMQEERERMRREVELAKDQALAEIWSRTADLVTQVSSRAIRRHINGDDQRRLVDDALAELKTVQS